MKLLAFLAELVGCEVIYVKDTWNNYQQLSDLQHPAKEK